MPEPPVTASVTAPASLSAVRAQLLDRIRRGEAASLAMGVVRDGAVIWEEGLGWADREASRPATADTRYAVASVSKSITATGALAMVGAGKLSLDQSAQSLLGDIHLQAAGGQPESVLVSHLLAHTSGIPHLWHYDYPDRPETLTSRRQLIEAYGFVSGSPGSRFLYTNLGYAVLAEIVARRAGSSFQQAMAGALLGPLGMRSTTVEAWEGDGGSVRGYDGKGRPIGYRFRLAPDGGAGFFSTVKDLLRYALFHLGESRPVALDQGAAIIAALDELPAGGPGNHYWRGWGVVSAGSTRVLISDGQAAGASAVLVLVPEHRLGVVVLCNQTGGPSVESALAILSSLVPGLGERIGETVTGLEEELAKPGAAPAGRFHGSLRDGNDSVPVAIDFTGAQAPVMTLGGSRYLLQAVGWERGMLQAKAIGSLLLGVGRDRRHNLLLTLWMEQSELHGIGVEEFADDRPHFGHPHFLRLSPTSEGSAPEFTPQPAPSSATRPDCNSHCGGSLTGGPGPIFN